MDLCIVVGMPGFSCVIPVEQGIVVIVMALYQHCDLAIDNTIRSSFQRTTNNITVHYKMHSYNRTNDKYPYVADYAPKP